MLTCMRSLLIMTIPYFSDPSDERDSPTVPEGLEEDQQEGLEMSEAEGDTEKDAEETGEKNVPSQPCPPSRPKIHSRKFRE